MRETIKGRKEKIKGDMYWKKGDVENRNDNKGNEITKEKGEEEDG